MTRPPDTDSDGTGVGTGVGCDMGCSDGTCVGTEDTDGAELGSNNGLPDG